MQRPISRTFFVKLSAGDANKRRGRKLILPDQKVEKKKEKCYNEPE